MARRRGARGAALGRACCAAATEAARGSAAALLLVVLKLGRAGARAALALMVITRTGARALLLLLLKTPLRRARWRRAPSFCARCPRITLSSCAMSLLPALGVRGGAGRGYCWQRPARMLREGDRAGEI